MHDTTQANIPTLYEIATLPEDSLYLYLEIDKQEPNILYISAVIVALISLITVIIQSR